MELLWKRSMDPLFLLTPKIKKQYLMAINIVATFSIKNSAKYRLKRTKATLLQVDSLRIILW